ncbi:hypothetical protein PAMP_014325 [Pampus punctatissimus]
MYLGDISEPGNLLCTRSVTSDDRSTVCALNRYSFGHLRTFEATVGYHWDSGATSNHAVLLLIKKHGVYNSALSGSADTSSSTIQEHYGGAEWPLGRSGSAPPTDSYTDRRRVRQLFSSLAVRHAAVPVCLSAPAAIDHPSQLETQTGRGRLVSVSAGQKRHLQAEVQKCTPEGEEEEEHRVAALTHLTTTIYGHMYSMNKPKEDI